MQRCVSGRLVIFARAPVAGRVKTRLCPPLSPGQGAALAAAFLLDEVEAFRTLPCVRLTVAFTPADAEPAFLALFEEDPPELLPQEGADLGERLLNAFRYFAGTPTVVVGADSPDLPPALVAE